MTRDKRRAKRSSRHREMADVLNSSGRLKVMGRLVHRVSKRAGSAPGTIVHTGKKKIDNIRLSCLDYDSGELREKYMVAAEECLSLRDVPTVSWINVDGLHDIELLERLGRHFGLHPLVLEDIASVNQRAKVEEFEDYIFIVMHMLFFDVAENHVHNEQLSMVVGENYIISFQERIGDVFEPVRERLRAGKGRIRSRGADYLAYALIDAVVDNYYSVLEKIGDRAEVLDDAVMENPTEQTIHEIHALKREMLVVRRSVWPLREAIASLYRSDHALVSGETKVFLRDVYDHTVQVLDTVETLRDLTAGLTDLYLSAVGHRQNEVMKVLTIMASIFIPLTFLAGIYGMNFEKMPELALSWAYPTLLSVMAVTAVAMAWYFKRRGWW